MRLLTPVVVLLTLLALGLSAANALGDPSARSSATTGVSVRDDFFSPSSKAVSKGTTVKWTWRGSAAHNVTVRSGPVRFSSPTKSSGTFSKKLSKAGTYRIVCTIHSGMAMTVRVRR